MLDASESECTACHESNSNSSPGVPGSQGLIPPQPVKGLNFVSQKMANDNNTVFRKAADTIANSPLCQQVQRNYVRTLLEDDGDDSLMAESEALWEWCDSIL